MPFLKSSILAQHSSEFPNKHYKMTILKYCQIIMEKSDTHKIHLTRHRSPEHFSFSFSLSVSAFVSLSLSAAVSLCLSVFLSVSWSLHSEGGQLSCCEKPYGKTHSMKNEYISVKSQQGPEACQQPCKWARMGFILQLILRKLQPRQHLGCSLMKGFEIDHPAKLLS